MSTVYLIRHGITEGNARRLYYGSTDLPLTEEGIRAIKERKSAGIYPDREGFELITSGLLRTKQTLFEIYGEAEHVSDNRLNEVDFGEFEMKSYEELKDREDYQQWISGDNWNNVCPGGESGEIMFQRALSAMNEYSLRNCIIVCHGGIISSLMHHYFPNDPEKEHFYMWQPKPCEGYRINFDSEQNPVDYSKIAL